MRDSIGERPGSVLVVRTSSVGDIVLAEPVVAALRSGFPDATLGFVIDGRYVDLVRGNPGLANLHLLRGSSFGDIRALAAEIRAAGYDVVVDLHRNLRSLLLTRLSGARLVTAYRKREPLTTLRVRLMRGSFRARARLVQRYLDALAPLGIDTAYRAPRYFPADDDRERADARIAALGLERRAFAAVVPGAVWPTKRWPADRFAAVIERLGAELGLPSVLLGSDRERGLCEAVAGGAGAARVLAGEAGLGESAALISGARLYVGNDSGPTHIAVALGVPTVAVFGPTDPGQFDFGGHRVLYADLDCSACSFYGSTSCKLGHWRCMTSVSVDDVFAAAADLARPEAGEGES